jgi:uncharacterized membrane protein YhaH (DUF805 family)
MRALFPEKLERLQYFVRLLLYFISVAIIAAFLLPLTKSVGIPPWLPLVIIILLVLLRFPCLDMPRFRSMGWSPWLVLLFFIPLVNFIMQLLLFFVPPKQSDAVAPQLLETHSPDWMKRNWKWLVPLLCLAVLVIVGWFTVFVENLMKSSGAYSGALSLAKSNSAVLAALGTPIKDGLFVSGTISENDSWGSASLVFPITGPKGSANVYVSAGKSADKWHFDNLFVQIDKTRERIDLLATNPLPVALPTDLPAAKKP